ncbi:hypothetical protein ACFYPC_33890 [Streptomyces sp. NPDC005808]|uniref:hypothetical protein n=1 Tax=Streptomyces sp. NPDC005808 TaxID=3364734 RepID=UPI0036AA3463
MRHVLPARPGRGAPHRYQLTDDGLAKDALGTCLNELADLRKNRKSNEEASGRAKRS